jgi:hypothetical protein
VAASPADDSPAPAPEVPQPALPVLPYVNWATRRGITFETGDRTASFILPPPPFWLRPEVLAPVAALLLFAPQLYAAVARGEVYDIRYVEHSGNIVVRAHRREMVEFRPSADDRIVRWIAAELRRALGLPA